MLRKQNSFKTNSIIYFSSHNKHTKMELFLQIIITFFIGIAAAIVGAITGGSGLITIPGMILIGVPVEIAIATTRVGTIALNAVSAEVYAKKHKIIWKYVIPLSILGVIGSSIGALLLIDFNKDILELVVGIIILSLLPIIYLEKNMGIKDVETSKLKHIIAYILLFPVYIFAGFFGGGAAIFVNTINVGLFGITYIESNATSRIPWLIISIVTFTIFAFSGFINYALGISLALGMVIGAYIGAQEAMHKGNAWVKIVFVVVILASATKLLFF
jgi:uncharacterized protein